MQYTLVVGDKGVGCFGQKNNKEGVNPDPALRKRWIRIHNSVKMCARKRVFLSLEISQIKRIRQIR